MGVGAFIEPLVVVSLLFGGTFVNRNRTYRLTLRKPRHDSPSVESGYQSPTIRDSLLDDADTHSDTSHSTLLPAPEPKYHKRQLNLFGWHREVTSPNTAVFQDRFLSRLLRKFPFLVEAWYWALIYWVYQLGRAASALMLVEGTVNTARRHALQVIHLEQSLRIFIEVPVQKFFLARPAVMVWINRIYSFIHIPGTILFLVWLFYYTTTSPSTRSFTRSGFYSRSPRKDVPSTYLRETSPTSSISSHGSHTYSPPHSVASPALYEARRRTMAMCNLIAFIIFTLWPCMPPRLLSDPDVPGPVGEEARSYGFVDTVHGAGGESSVWTQNKFCNQYAAMPSLHFGYSLLIGVTIMTIPVSVTTTSGTEGRRVIRVPGGRRFKLAVPSWRRLLCILVGFAYPATILVAIVATANHFVLDAVAGSMVCALAWKGNGILLNLLPLEDWFLKLVRIHKPNKEEKWEDERGWD